METEIRIACFILTLFSFAAWEIASPRRQLSVSKAERWFNNLALVCIDSLLVKLLLPVAAMGVATAAHQNGWGLFNFFHLPTWLSLLISLLILDLVLYLQHLLFHATPLLWRLHMVHHADLDIDTSTGLRFHPIEIMLSMLIKMTTVAALGLPVLSVFIFEILLNTTSLFNHSNIRLPGKSDRYLRMLVVTPDMHRVHHSVIIRETNSNFSFNFPWWDRLFGTYRAQPAIGHTGMTIGLSQFRKVTQVTLSRLLLLPFTGKPGHYSLTHIGKDPKMLATQHQKKEEK